MYYLPTTQKTWNNAKPNSCDVNDLRNITERSISRGPAGLHPSTL